MKKLPAFVAALITTIIVGGLMLGIGANALLNPTSVQALNSPAVAGSVQNVSTVSDPNAQAQIQQLQARIKEYQAREKQYQSQLNQAQQSLAKATTDLQQYQGLVQQLSQMGVIRVDRSGQIFLPRGFEGGDDHDNN